MTFWTDCLHFVCWGPQRMHERGSRGSLTSLRAPGWALMHAKQLPGPPSAAPSRDAPHPRPSALSASNTNLSAPRGFQQQPFLWRAVCFASLQCFGVPVSWISLQLVDPLLSEQGNVDWSVRPDWPPAVRGLSSSLVLTVFCLQLCQFFSVETGFSIDVDAWSTRARSHPAALQCCWNREGWQVSKEEV